MKEEKKKKDTYKSRGFKIDVIVIFTSIPVIFLFVGFCLWLLDVELLKETYSYLEVFPKKMKDIVMITICLWILLLIAMFKMLQFKKPKQTDDLASARWTSIQEQKNFFGIAPVDTSKTLAIGGSPIHLIAPDTLLYEKEAVHDICVGTTRSGKSRKIVRQLVMLCSMATESMIFNDPKKEFYFDFRKYLEKKGYQVFVLDFRNLQFSNCWNPLGNVIACIEREDIDEADQYAQDIVTALVVDTGAGEKIWIDGQKALIKGLILAVCSAPIPNHKKNFYSVYQTLALLGGEISVGNKHSKGKVAKAKLSIFMESLPETDVSRVAYTAVANAPEKTKGSFMTSALSTLSIFSSSKLAKVLSRSDFSFQEFKDGKKAVFIVNPDEKKTYNSITAMAFDQAYQELVFEANQMPGTHLTKKVHMILDEAGNMPVIDGLPTKLSVALSRWIVYHLHLQDFSQHEEAYGDKQAQTIRSNCNLWYFISSQDFDTCKKVSEKIGKETIWVDSVGGNYSQAGGSTGGNVGYSKQTRALMDENELNSADNRDGKGIIIMRTYSQPSKVYLPDASQYAWYKEMEHDETQIEREDQSLGWAIPRFIEIVDDNNQEVMNLENSLGFAQKGKNDLKEENMYWYWSTRNDLEESVKNHIVKQRDEYNEHHTEKFSISNYMKSNAFLQYLHSIDIVNLVASADVDLDVAMQSDDGDDNELAEMFD